MEKNTWKNNRICKKMLWRIENIDWKSNVSDPFVENRSPIVEHA